jgi:poly-beta-hydroxyalkanoate depolymerase
MLFEKSNTLLECNFNNWVFAFEWFKFELFIDGFQLSSEFFLQTIENVWEEFSKEIKDFEVMLFDSHLDIQAYKLTHMSVSERVLCSKNWTNFKDALEISHNAHLLIQLW